VIGLSISQIFRAKYLEQD